jgi:hypothetical protein
LSAIQNREFCVRSTVSQGAMIGVQAGDREARARASPHAA